MVLTLLFIKYASTTAFSLTGPYLVHLDKQTFARKPGNGGEAQGNRVLQTTRLDEREKVPIVITSLGIRPEVIQGVHSYGGEDSTDYS
jgi:hypothetical protein